jgi:hypothetical protein
MDNVNYNQLHKMYQNVRKVNSERIALGHKKRLIANIEKKFRTAMIGTLARCEEQLGFLWGHGKDFSILDKNQREFRVVWDNLRTEILNHCNNQLRAAIEEISEYNITWNQYRTEFIINRNHIKTGDQ